MTTIEKLSPEEMSEIFGTPVPNTAAPSPVVPVQETQEEKKETPISSSTIEKLSPEEMSEIFGTPVSGTSATAVAPTDDPNIFGTGALSLVGNRASLVEQKKVPTSERRLAVPIVPEEEEEEELPPLPDVDPAVDDPALVEETEFPAAFGTGSLLVQSGTSRQNVQQMRDIPTSEEAEDIPFDVRFTTNQLQNQSITTTSGPPENFNVQDKDGNLVGYSAGKEWLFLADNLWKISNNGESFPDNYTDKMKADWLMKRASQVGNSFFELGDTILKNKDTDLYRNMLGIDLDKSNVSVEDQLYLWGKTLQMYDNTRGSGRTARYALQAIALDPVSWVGLIVSGGFRLLSRVVGSKTIGNLPLNYIKNQLTKNLTKKGFTKEQIDEALEFGSSPSISKKVLESSVNQVSRLGPVKGAAVAATYTGGFDLLDQTLRVQTNLQDEINLGQVAKSAAIGLVATPLAAIAPLPTVRAATKKLARQQDEAARFVGPKLPSEKVIIEPDPKDVAAKGAKNLPQRNIIIEGLGNVNSWLGRGLRETAGLPDRMAAAARKLNRPKIYSQMRLLNKELDKAVKNKNVNENDITEYMETGELPKTPTGTQLDTEITDVIDRYRKTIYDNQEELSNLAGLNGDARLGSQYTYNPKTGKGTIYYTRSYQAAYDPRFVEIIDRALKGKSVVAITGPEKRRKSKVLDAIDAGRSFYKQQLLEGLEGKNKGLRLSDENALDEAQIQALQKDPDSLFLNANQQAEIDGQLKAFINHVSHAEDGLGIESWLNATTHTDNISKVLRKRNEQLDPKLRKLLGETTDPFEKLRETLKNQNDTIARARYIRDLDSYLKEVAARDPDSRYIEISGILPFNLGPKKRIAVTSRPSLEGTKALEDYAQRLLGSGRAGKSDLMKDLYTSSNMFKLIDNNINLLNRSSTSKLMRVLQGIASFGQASQTLFDVPSAYMLNTIGMLQGLGINGVFLQPVKTFRNTGKTALMFYRSVKNNNREALELFDFLRESGVVEAGIVAEPIIRNVAFMDSPAQLLTPKGILKGGMAAYRKGIVGLGKAYGATDAFGKTILFFNELDGLKKAFPDLPEDELRKLAAKRVTDNFWTYSRAAPIAREIARVPVIGNYVLFPSEGIRVHKNLIKTAATDVVQGLSRAQRGESGGIAQTQMGLRRVAGLTAMGYGMSSFVQTNNEGRGVTSKTEEVMNVIMPSYYRDKLRFFLDPLPPQITEEGTNFNRFVRAAANFVNSDKQQNSPAIKENDDGDIVVRLVVSPQFDAFSVTNEPARIAMQLLGDIISGKDINPDNYADRTEQAMKDLLGTYLSPKFVADAVLDILSGSQKIFDPLYEKTDKENIDNIFEAILKSNMVPGARDTITRAREALAATDPVRLQQLKDERAVANFGMPVSMDDFFTWITTGMRVQNMSINKQISFKTYQDLNRIGMTAKNFRNYLRRLPAERYTPETETEILEEYGKMQVRRFELLQELGTNVAKYKSLSYEDKRGEDQEYGDRIWKDLDSLLRSSKGEDLKLVGLTGSNVLKPKDYVDTYEDFLKEGLFMPDSLSSGTVEGTMFMDATQTIPNEFRGPLMSKLNRLDSELRGLEIQGTDPQEIEEIITNFIQENQE